MLKRTDSFVESEDDLILDYFSAKCAIERFDVFSIIVALDDWWYVPRSDEAKREASIRTHATYEQWRETGTLPSEYECAFHYARSHKCKMVEESYRAYIFGGGEQ